MKNSAHAPNKIPKNDPCHECEVKKQAKEEKREHERQKAEKRAADELECENIEADLAAISGIETKSDAFKKFIDKCKADVEKKRRKIV